MKIPKLQIKIMKGKRRKVQEPLKVYVTVLQLVGKALLILTTNHWPSETKPT